VSMLIVWTENIAVTNKSAAVSKTETNVSMLNVLPTWIAKPTLVQLTDVSRTNVKIKSAVRTNTAGKKWMQTVTSTLILMPSLSVKIMIANQSNVPITITA
jgi:hypothetical protein